MSASPTRTSTNSRSSSSRKATRCCGRSPQFRLGNASRNPVRGPGYRTADIAFIKRTYFGEIRNFEFRTEIFNLFNHFNPDPQTVDLGLNSQTFGTVGGGVRGVTTRVVQLGAKLYF